MSSALPIIRHLGQEPYLECWERMQAFTNTRDAQTDDELWVVEHSPVYTLGQAGKTEHILNAGDIPIVQSDRGGQVTYHGPGQVLVYTLLNIRARKIGVRTLVVMLENAVIDCLAAFDIEAVGRRDAPGVYVKGAKIAALGLRVRRGCTYHGLSLNIDVDLQPFDGINPCGFAELPVTSMERCGVVAKKADIVERLLQSIHRQLRLA
jgi:lipoyl(octanoyl) transferase